MSVNEQNLKENSHNTKIKESWSPKQNTKGEIECCEGEYNFRDALFVIRVEQYLHRLMHIWCHGKVLIDHSPAVFDFQVAL